MVPLSIVFSIHSGFNMRLVSLTAKHNYHLKETLAICYVKQKQKTTIFS